MLLCDFRLEQLPPLWGDYYGLRGRELAFQGTPTSEWKHIHPLPPPPESKPDDQAALC